MDENYKVQSLSPEIEEVYIKMDRLLGEILDKIPHDTSIIVASDHGFTSFDYSIDMNRWLVENGFMTLFLVYSTYLQLHEWVMVSSPEGESLPVSRKLH